MKALLRWSVVLAAGLALCVSLGEAETKVQTGKLPEATALVGQVIERERPDAILLIAGYVTSRGWVDSTEAKGLMHHEDKLSLYALHVGRVGSAQLTDDGYDLAQWNTVAPPSSWDGVGYSARLRFAEPQRKAAGDEIILAVWHAPGTPEPRWVRAKTLDPKSSTYRGILAEWLRRQGVPKQPEHGLTVRQIVRADVNGDGREEVFLSFMWSERSSSQPHSAVHGGLMMRYLPPGSREPRLVMVLDDSHLVYTVAGLCDLDSDGWAELVVQHAGQECGGMCLCHWTGQGFTHMSGYSAGG